MGLSDQSLPTCLSRHHRTQEIYLGKPANQERGLGGGFRGQTVGPQPGRAWLKSGMLSIAVASQGSQWPSLGLNTTLICHPGACGSEQTNSSENQNSTSGREQHWAFQTVQAVSKGDSS